MTAYVRVLDEGTECYRPVSLRPTSQGRYEITGAKGSLDPEEVWEFPLGSEVSLTMVQASSSEIEIVAKP